MQEQQRFIIRILLQKQGLTEAESIKIIRIIECSEIEYEKIINRLADIKEIYLYLNNQNYDQKIINQIIGEMLKKEILINKIESIDKICNNNNYTIKEKQKIMSKINVLYNKSISSIDNKLAFYNELEIKKEVLMYPSRINYPLNILYARMSYLKDISKYEQYKNRIYEKSQTFEKDFRITTEELICRYPLPDRYKPKQKEYHNYTNKEKNILSIIFIKMGLTEAEAKDLINKLNEKSISYEKIKKAKDNISHLIQYFKNNSYNQDKINCIIANTAYKQSPQKIFETDKVLINNNCNDKQREQIESKNSNVFNFSEELLDKKIKLMDDENIPKELLSNCRVSFQSLELTYARIRFLKSLGKKPLEYTNILFREEHRFKNKFGINTKDLIERFPITEEKYKVKTKNIKEK